jgi:hypothetical protein
VEGEFTLDTDTSDFAIGAVLSQQQNGVERVVAYASRSLDRREKNYCVTRKQLLAVFIFFVSSNNIFLVVTSKFALITLLCHGCDVRPIQ